MRMSDFVVREAIVPDLAATSKEGVIREMVENLRRTGYFPGAEADEIIKAIHKRELLGSTGIGRGVAIPHAKHDSVNNLVGTVAVSRNGVAFDSIDGEPVYILCMLISPKERPSEHLRALEGVSRSLRDENFVRQLRQATTPEQVWSLIVEQDRQHGA